MLSINIFKQSKLYTSVSIAFNHIIDNWATWLCVFRLHTLYTPLEATLSHQLKALTAPSLTWRRRRNTMASRRFSLFLVAPAAVVPGPNADGHRLTLYQWADRR